MFGKEGRDPRIDPPIHVEYCRDDGATTLNFPEGTSETISFIFPTGGKQRFGNKPIMTMSNNYKLIYNFLNYYL